MGGGAVGALALVYCCLLRPAPKSNVKNAGPRLLKGAPCLASGWQACLPAWTEKPWLFFAWEFHPCGDPWKADSKENHDLEELFQFASKQINIMRFVKIMRA